MRSLLSFGCMLSSILAAGGCSAGDPAQRVIFLDGAGHLGAGMSVERGLRAAGYEGEFKVFHWQSGLLWGVDHLVAARSEATAQKLADEITLHRRQFPQGFLAVMGLSAGTNVLLSALELLPEGVQVNHVVLFQPSVSSLRNLAPAMRGVRGRLYATCSPSDMILTGLLTTSDGGPLPAAGKVGFRVPLGLPAAQRQPYVRVVNLPWSSKYSRYGWGGGHVSSTSAAFVRHVVAPRLLQPAAPESDLSRRADTAAAEESYPQSGSRAGSRAY